MSGKYREIDDEGERKTCMAGCDDQTFTVTSSSNKFPGEEDFNHREQFCIIVKLVTMSAFLKCHIFLLNVSQETVINHL